ncbi:MAG TPA: hypothetical protein VH208_08195 [Myxococcaceae bacterium]|jgi:hypothetical protein|nr:hypothetical protein [Myxococcaceae bacterium]
MPAIDGVRADVVLPEIRCAGCEQVLSSAGTHEGELVFAQLLANVGTASGWAFSVLRKTLKLSEQGAAELLQVRRETISRWENAKGQVDRMAWVTLGSMVDDEILGRRNTASRLLATTRPKIPEEPVQLVAPLAPVYTRPPIPTRLPEEPKSVGARPPSRRKAKRKHR